MISCTCSNLLVDLHMPLMLKSTFLYVYPSLQAIPENAGGKHCGGVIYYTYCMSVVIKNPFQMCIFFMVSMGTSLIHTTPLHFIMSKAYVHIHFQ